MSEYHKQTTKFKDEACLLDALVAAGYRMDQIEVHKEAQQMYDYHGRATRYLDKNGDKANIIIRRGNVGYSAANDVGFKFNPETGTYDAIISQYDSGNAHWGAESTRMKTTEQAYAEGKLKKTLAKQGFKYLGRKIVNGRIQVQYMDTRA